MASEEDHWFDDYDEMIDDGDSSQEPSKTSPSEPLNDDTTASPPRPPASKATSVDVAGPRGQLYTIIDKPSLERAQQRALEQVRGILACNTTTARALLTFFRWDAEAVLSTIAERGEQEVYRRAGVLSRAADEAAHADVDGSAANCSVCFTEMIPEESVAMSCGHVYCRECWRQHLGIGICEGQSRRLRCMAPGCGVLCDEDAVRSVLVDAPNLLEKFEHALVDGYVDDNKCVKWCPSVPHCGRAVRVTGDPHLEIDCPCGQHFCFACCEAPHTPATCEMSKEWSRRINDGSETASWMNAHTKSCPKCAKPVEKNGGCNLVLCYCGQAFCWLCGQPTGRAHDWNSIQGHSCGAYRDEVESKATEAQRTLNRYLHYLTRYEAHLASLKLEERARVELDKKIATLMDAATLLSNYAWLHSALQQLFVARRVLAFSYVFAFFVFGPAYKDEFPPAAAATTQALFEDKQARLEGEVERLANLVEKTPAELMGHERQVIINAASAINSRIVKLYEVIENDIAPQVAGRAMAVAPYIGRWASTSMGGGFGGGEVVDSVPAPGSADGGEGEKKASAPPVHKRARQR